MFHILFLTAICFLSSLIKAQSVGIQFCQGLSKSKIENTTQNINLASLIIIPANIGYNTPRLLDQKVRNSIWTVVIASIINMSYCCRYLF
jgi:hypothetical protein